MKAAEMKERPTFTLMKQTDVQSIYHMQMPRWLFSDPRYADMSLDAKVAYTFLLNRFQLSRRNGWVNDHGEVFVIFPRKELARELRVGEKRVTAAFQKLAELNLIWEKRCGRGDANQIYLASVQPEDDPAYTCAPFVSEEPEHDGSRTAGMAGLTYGNTGSEPQKPPLPPVQNRQNDVSRTVGGPPAGLFRQMPEPGASALHPGGQLPPAVRRGHDFRPAAHQRPGEGQSRADRVDLRQRHSAAGAGATAQTFLCRPATGRLAQVLWLIGP